MLYISRCLPDRTYGVVDTDDDVETRVTLDELYSALLEYDIEIVGVNAQKNGSHYQLKTVSIYQDPRYSSPLMVKTRMIHGVDVGVFRNEVVLVKADGASVSRDVVLRVSDYAKEFCGTSPVIWSPETCDEHVITLVFDDKVKINGIIEYFGAHGFVFDFTEYSDDVYVDSLYKELLQDSLTDVSDWDSFVIDRVDRLDFWKHVGIVEGCVSPQEELCEWYMSDIVRFEQYSRRIAKMYKSEFESMSNIVADMKFFTTLAADKFVPFCENLLGGSLKEFLTCTDYEDLHERFQGMFTILRVASTVNSYTLGRFERFIKFFDVPDDLKAVYTSCCKLVAKAFVKYCSENGIEV